MQTNNTFILNQIMVRKWAYFGSTYLGNDLFYLLEFIDLCLEDLGEDNVVEMLKTDNSQNKKRLNQIGENWNKFSRQYAGIKSDVVKSKVYYDKIEKKDFSKIDSADVQIFLRCSKRIQLIQKEIYALAIFLLAHSKIRGQTVKDTDFKVLENTGLKKLEVVPRRAMLDHKMENDRDGTNR